MNAAPGPCARRRPALRITTIVGARPQFIKAAMVSREIARRGRGDAGPPAREILVHTGQHGDANMSDVFFDELELPRPDVHVAVVAVVRSLRLADQPRASFHFPKR